MLGEAGKICPKRIKVYLVGGAAMAIRGEKAATKDVDLILEFLEDAWELTEALRRLGFQVNLQHPLECKELVDAEILTTSKGMRVDIFVETVCHKLFLSEGIKRRSEYYGALGQISLSICSREDIFLLKSVTERNRDLDDMVVLYRKGIDKEILISECQSQDRYDSLISGRIWEAFLTTKVEEMENQFGISVPWKRELKRVADLKLGSKMVLDQIKAGVNTIHGISDRLHIEPNQVRRYLSSLERDGIVFLDKTVRPNIILLK
ncbi:MAG: hypothetical protein ABR986_03110 [Methanomassiliicoccales archaeon]